MSARTRLLRTFAGEAIGVLRSVANTLTLAIERRQAEYKRWRHNVEITKLAEEVARLADDRRQILADALDAEDRTREQISQVLHDEVLQSLLSARQDLTKARRTESTPDEAITQAQEAVVEAISELRHVVIALHPVTRARGGLVAVIQAIADVHARRGGFEVTLEAEPEAGYGRDQLLASLTQELLNNVAQHAHASHATITLCRSRDRVVFEVADDGCGMSQSRPTEALAAGHVGLASIAMRVKSCDGCFHLTTRPGEGTCVQIMLPAHPSPPAPGSNPSSSRQTARPAQPSLPCESEHT